jgi:hypothetical protein
MLNAEYDKEYIFDVNDYLIKNYPTMTLNIRRAVCAVMYDYIDDEAIGDAVDAAVGDYAMAKMKVEKKVEDDEEEA